MKLHENKRLFRQAIQFTADTMNVPSIYIEKDYWVTFALYTIFNHEIGKDVVFKGGTSLSKCYNLIDRFSEDIDLVVLRHQGETDNTLKMKLKNISTVVGNYLPEIEIEGVTRKFGMNRKTAHSYKKEFNGNYGQVRDVIVLESSWLGYHEPYTTKNIISYVGQMMLEKQQSDLAIENNLTQFSLSVLEPTRTICEKIMSLVRFSYSNTAMDDLKKKIRHIYDIHQLIKQKDLSDFFMSKDFDKMLLRVANDDITSFKNNNDWLVFHPNEALIFKDSINVWKELKTVYSTDFKNLVYGSLPDEESVLETLKTITERLKNIEWVVKIQ